MLPSISKITEWVIHDQTNAFLSDEDLLYNYQSGFRGNHSTNLCLPFLTDKFAKLKIPYCKTNMGQQAISFVGPSLWNSLPELIKKTDELF